MPNTPCVIGQAASAYVLGNHCNAEDAARIFTLLSAVGRQSLQCFDPGLKVQGSLHQGGIKIGARLSWVLGAELYFLP